MKKSSLDNKNITHDFFATPFLRTFAGHDKKIDDLKFFLLTCENDNFVHSKSPQESHNALFESRFDLFSWPDEHVQQIKNRLLAHLMNYLSDVNCFSVEDLKKLNFRIESWFHISRKGAYFQPHTHPLASVSMIYCVDPGDEVIDDLHEAGCVLFTDPRLNASMYVDPANRNMKRKYSFDGLRFRLRSDELCIFPSYLQHSVEPYVGDTPRITIAANFSFSLNE